MVEHDTYGRIVGKDKCSKVRMSALEQIKAGKTIKLERTRNCTLLLKLLPVRARLDWIDLNAIPPWEFRGNGRMCFSLTFNQFLQRAEVYRIFRFITTPSAFQAFLNKQARL